jgi:type IV pilus assembly protein PilW
MRTKYLLTRGFTFIELLVGLCLSCLLMLVVLTVFNVLLRQYCLIQATVNMQVNAMLAVELLHKQLRMAGFMGCAKVKDVAIVAKNVVFKPSYANSLYGFKAGLGQPKAWHNKLPGVKPDSDVVVSWFKANKSYFTEARIKKPGYLLAASCQHAELLTTAEASAMHGAKREIAPLYYYAYYIRRSASTNSSRQAAYGLFRKSLLASHSPAQELVLGIEDMQISYGVSKVASAGLVFMPAAKVANWQAVKALRIELLVNSLKAVLPKPQSYLYQGSWHTAHDHLLRRSWVTYIALRQR